MGISPKEEMTNDEKIEKSDSRRRLGNVQSILTLLLCSALCYSLSDVYSKLSTNYEIIISLENRHETTKNLIFERQERLAIEMESIQKKMFDLEKSMMEDIKHIIANLNEKQITNDIKITEIENINLSKLAEMPVQIEKLDLKLKTLQANINDIKAMKPVEENNE